MAGLAIGTGSVAVKSTSFGTVEKANSFTYQPPVILSVVS